MYLSKKFYVHICHAIVDNLKHMQVAKLTLGLDQKTKPVKLLVKIIAYSLLSLPSLSLKRMSTAHQVELCACVLAVGKL